MDDHKAMMRLLRAARGTLGRDGLNALLRPPFAVFVNDHSTGCQGRISAHAHGQPTVDVWCGSIWDAPCYEFNDADKVLGMQPGCDWAVPLVRAFFAAVAERHAACMVNRSLEAAGAQVHADRVRSAALAAYRTMAAERDEA